MTLTEWPDLLAWRIRASKSPGSLQASFVSTLRYGYHGLPGNPITFSHLPPGNGALDDGCIDSDAILSAFLPIPPLFELLHG